MPRDLLTGPPSGNDTDHDLLVKLAKAAQDLSAGGSFDPASPGPIGGVTPDTIAGTTGTFSGTVTGINVPVFKRNATDTVRASTSYVTDSAFDLAVGAEQTWRLHYRLFYVEGNGAGAKAQLTFPATATQVNGSGIIWDDGSPNPIKCDIASDATQPCPLFSTADMNYHVTDYTITLTTAAGGGGTVSLQWGCSLALDVTLLANSTLTATRIT